MSFSDKLRLAQARSKSWVCLGLDTDVQKLPYMLSGDKNPALAFNRAIIDATRDLVCAYKPNLGFYLSRGRAGLDTLLETVAAIPSEIPIVLDAKFGDIDSTAKGYAQFAFQVVGADAVTVNPYLGADSLAPFQQFEGRAIFILAHTSNPGAGVFQDALLGDAPLFVQVARFAKELKGKADVGLVVGATFPDQLRQVREANSHALLLIPGVGAQGGSLGATVEYGKNDIGVGPLINASRSILYASNGKDYAAAARSAAAKMRDEINALCA